MGNVLSNGFQAATSFFLEKAKYILELEDNLEALQEVARRLKAMKDDLQNQLEMEERKGLRALEEIKVWLLEVKAIQPKVTKLLEDMSAEIERLSMCGYCSSNFFLIYRYSKDVFETVEKVQSILSSKPSGEVARLGPPPGIEEIATQRTVGLEKVLEATWSRLMEKEVGILGLYGMGGIGKTTLLKQINNKLLEKKDEFEVVIFVVVSQNLQVEKIQNEIGERLGLCGQAWEKKTQNEKASSICGALTRKRFVMLLDDIWRKVDLVEEIIGIPLPSPKNGSKVVFTTRSKNVCGRMGSHDLEVKQLDLLNAWELFRQKVRGNTLESDPKILELAIQICIKCRGLPLALNVIGETMHDVIRQMGLWVASNFGEEEEKVIVKTGAGLQQMPEVRNWKVVRRMLLAKNKILNISGSPVCPNLTTLFLTYSWLVNISGEFFLSMPKLVLLDLSCNINLTKLPEEVTSLVSLRHLDLSLTSLENLPVGLGKLIQLRYLSLTKVRTLKSISVISSLVNIEILLVRDTICLSLELIEDFKLLKNLKGLGVSINDVVVLERLLSIPRLASCIRYMFLEGIVAIDGPLQFETAVAGLRSIMIHRCIISDIMEHTRYGFENLVFVSLFRVSGIQDLSWLLFAPNLTFLFVRGPSPELQEIISREKVSGIPFRKLRAMHLISLKELKSIYWERLELPCLKRMLIKKCPKLKKLPFSKERAYYFGLHAHNPEWFGGLEWEDEATED